MPLNSHAPARIARARAMYDDQAVPLVKIARFLKISPATLAKRRAEWDWPLRPARLRVGCAALAEGVLDAAAVDSAAARPEPPEPTLPLDAAALAQRLETTLLAQLSQLDAQLAQGKPGTALMERVARILASLVRSLAQVKQVQRGGNDDAASAGADAPENLGDLHDELARRLDGLRAERAA